MSDDATPKSELIQHSGVISKVNSIHHRGLNFIPMPLDTMLHTFWFNLLSLNCFSFFFPSFSTLKKGAFRKLCFCLVISTTLLSPRMMYIWRAKVRRAGKTRVKRVSIRKGIKEAAPWGSFGKRTMWKRKMAHNLPWTQFFNLQIISDLIIDVREDGGGKKTTTKRSEVQCWWGKNLYGNHHQSLHSSLSPLCICYTISIEAAFQMISVLCRKRTTKFMICKVYVSLKFMG